MNIKTIMLLIAGTVAWSLTMVKSGLCWAGDCASGIGFWGPNGHDGIWHISFAKSLAKGTWEIPIFSGEQIQNYHIGFDLLLAALHKLTFIPVQILYFQILPPAMALLVGFFVYKFVREWTNSTTKAWWSTFFVYFGGSWGWLVNLIRSGNWDGESMFWAQQSVSTLINPPFALSLVIIFVALYLLVSKNNHPQPLLEKEGGKNNSPPFQGGARGGLVTRIKSWTIKKRLTLATFLFGILIQIKVYAGLLALTGLFVAGFWHLIQRKGAGLIKVFLGSFLVSLFIFAPTSGDVSSVIQFKPFWFLESMMAYPDRFGWEKYGEAMVNYRSGGVFVKGITAYSGAFLMFWFGNLGTRLLSIPLLLLWMKNYKKIDFLQIFFVVVILAGIVVPTLFVQTGTPWNTIQFMYYSLMFSGIVAGVAVGKFVEEIKLNTSMIYIIEVVIILLTIPTTLATLNYHYLPNRPPAKISAEELEALEFLSKQPDGVVLTQPFDRQLAQAALSDPPRPLYAYESTAYVSAMSGKMVYLEDEVNLEIMGYDWRGRRSSVEDYFYEPDDSFLLHNDIKYIYMIKTIGSTNIDKENIFENSTSIIYLAK